MDLSALGQVSYIQFTMESTDSGTWGINTATIFCMDKLTVEKVNTTTTAVENTKTINSYRAGNTLYNLPVGGKLSIYRVNGSLYQQTEIRHTEMQLPTSEMLIIRITTNEGSKVIR